MTISLKPIIRCILFYLLTVFYVIFGDFVSAYSLSFFLYSLEFFRTFLLLGDVSLVFPNFISIHFCVHSLFFLKFPTFSILSKTLNTFNRFELTLRINQTLYSELVFEAVVIEGF